MTPLETYFRNLQEIYTSGAGVKETSYYGTLENLLNEIGKTLKPKVRCIINLKNQGAGLPDGGLFTFNQFSCKQTEEPFEGVFPERGVIEIKSTQEDVKKIANSEQVQKYWQKYGQILVTNYRDFLLIGRDKNGQKIELERYSLAPSESEFWAKTSNPRQLASEHLASFTEYLKRVLLQAAPIVSPSDLAWFLASYARDAKARLEKHLDIPALKNIRQALEDALGIKFHDEQGERFFRSTLVQTLFYGLFSAWVLWHKEKNSNRQDYFDWKTAAYYLHVPMLAALFEQIAAPSKLKALGLVEVLDWTGTALNRVRREEFFSTFNEGQAVQYFYEPFLQAFDPDLRKELGVWYTPPEIVRYMVARVDRVLREELDLEDGLANPNVYILDPCCGTGAYLVEVLRHIATTLQEKGAGALAMAQVKQAALKRVFGFEILTAPFVVAHLQLGLFLQGLGVPLVEESERVGVYLTNALTGWQPPDEEAKKKIQQLELSFPELNKEREAADEVKQGKPILVILGNPPYNAFAGTSPVEEDGLVEVYKEGLISDWRIKKFNLDELYVRFFRLAERCISENTGKGVVCYISSNSWVSKSSFVVLRKNLLKNFGKFWIENMHGDRDISEYAPDGRTSETIFAIPGFSVGIKKGTVISLWVKNNQKKEKKVLFRDDIDAAKAVERRAQLLASLDEEGFDSLYQSAEPQKDNNFSFRPSDISSDYLSWTKLTDLCDESPSNGLMEKRGGALMDIDKKRLESRMRMYYDNSIEWEVIKSLKAGLTEDASGFDSKKVRLKVQQAENYQPNRIIRYVLRPFEVRWCYYSDVSPLWNRSRPNLWAQCWEGNSFLISRFATAKNLEGSPFYFAKGLSDDHLLTPDASCFPIRLRPKVTQKTDSLFNTEQFIDNTPKANLSEKVRQYLTQLGIKNLDTDIENASLIWMHTLSIGYSPLYLNENADGIRQDFPRIPLPKTKETLLNSARLGQQIASLLDTENPVIGVTTRIRPEIKTIAIISRVGNGNLNPDTGDLNLTAGWGHGGKNGVTMPGKGKMIERSYTPEERAFLTLEMVNLLGNTTYDIYLNDLAYWKNIPSHVWEYTIGGYQVIKKWLSYREEKLLGRGLTIEEVAEVCEIARRISAIVLLESDLDANYQTVKIDTE